MKKMGFRLSSKTVTISFTVVLAFVFTTALLLPTICVADKGKDKKKVEVCHITGTYDFSYNNGGDNVPIGHVIQISASAYQAHIKHGDPEIWESVTLRDDTEACAHYQFQSDGPTVYKTPWMIYQNSPSKMNVLLETNQSVDNDSKHIYIDLNSGDDDCDENHGTECPRSNYKIVKDLSADTFLYTFACSGLTPNKDYDFKICSRRTNPGSWTKTFGSFRTAPEEISPRLGFYALGDSRGGSVYTDKVAKNIAYDQSHYGGDFVIHTGDIVFNGGQVCHWDSSDGDFVICPWNDNFWVWDGVKEMTSSMPIFTTIGNHDFSGGDYPNIYFYYRYFKYLYPDPPSDYQDLEHLYYSYDWGPATFFSLTNYPITSLCGTAESMAPGMDQMIWLEKQLSENESPWKIAFMHVAAYSCECVLKTYRDDLVTLFEDYGVDLVLQGHNHYYARKTHSGIPYLTLGGGGAPLESINYADCREGEGAAAEEKYHYARFHTDHDYMKILAIDENRKVFDEILLDKNPKPSFSAYGTGSGSRIYFSGKSTGHVSNREWDFGDGNTSTEQDPVHDYATNGSYEVTLTACSFFKSCSKYTRTIDVPLINPDNPPPPVCTPAWNYEPNSIPGWWGSESDGGGIAVADIDKNGKPELFAFNINDPDGDNQAYYRIGWNLKLDGTIDGTISDSFWSDRIEIPWFGAHQQGGGLAVADINGDGTPDLIVFGIDNPVGENQGFYRIGWNLQPDGSPQSWSDLIWIPGWWGSESDGGGIAVADIDKNGKPELFVFNIDNPDGENRAYFRIGVNLDSNGQADLWGPIDEIPSWQGWHQQGGGFAVADINKNGKPELFAFGIDNPDGENSGLYRIGWDMDIEGNYSGWSDPISFPGWFGTENQGGGLAVADINANGYPDLIPFSIDNPLGENTGYYRIGWDLQSNGRAVSFCGQPYEIGDTGPAGGCVFHVSEDGLHGLEVAPQDQSDAAEWGCKETIIGANGKAMGTGKYNTDKILAACTTSGTAAQIAGEYSLNGYTDWFLPAFDSLFDLIDNGACPSGFDWENDDIYWSSSEWTDSTGEMAWFLSLWGSQGGLDKSTQSRVRAVRAF